MTNERPAEFDAQLLDAVPFLRHYVRRIAPAAEHDDIIQETLAEAMRRWSSYRPDGAFKHWLTFIMRSSARVRRKPIPRPPSLPPASPTQEHRVDIGLILERVPPRERDVLVAHAQGYTMEEIGSSMGVTKQRAHQMMLVGRKRLIPANDNGEADRAAA